MPIHFAPSRRASHSVLARCLSRPDRLCPTNDNGDARTDTGQTDTPQIDTPLLRAALEHFAGHGLAAASTAHDMADAARKAGDRAEQHHWMAVCRTLDRRLPARRAR